MSSNFTTTSGQGNSLCVPELPKSIVLDKDNAQKAGGLLNQYVDYANKISPMTPRLFHESSMLTLISGVIARRMVLKMPFGDIYPSLYILWIAPSTLFRKTTAMQIGFRNFFDKFRFLLLPNDTTPEALFSNMAGIEPLNLKNMPSDWQDLWQKGRDYSAQKIWTVDEASGLLASFGRDYNAGLLEALLRFYDCENSFTRSTKGEGYIQIRYSYLTMIGASTPVALSRYLCADRLWSNGFWPRFALLSPETERPDWAEAVAVTPPDEIVQRVEDIFNNLPASKWPNAPQALPVNMGQAVYNFWNTYNKAVSYDLLTPDLDNRLYAAYGRLPTHTLKVATLLSALDWGGGNPPEILLPHLLRAIQIVEGWRFSFHRVLRDSDLVNNEQIGDRILKVLLREPNGLSLRDITRNMRNKTRGEIMNMLSHLEFIEEVEKVKNQTGANGGRPTDLYRIKR
jgi:hypothetical protein